MIMSFTHSKLEVGRRNPEEDSVVPHIMKLWKQEEKIIRRVEKRNLKIRFFFFCITV